MARRYIGTARNLKSEIYAGDAAATRADGHSGLPAVPEEDDAAALAASARASRLPGKGISRARDNFRWLNSGCAARRERCVLHG